MAALYNEPLPVLPVPEGQNGFFCHGKEDEAFFLREWSEDVNLRLLLLPSQNGFAWMKAQAADLARLFRALSNTYTGFPFLVSMNLPGNVYNMMPYIVCLIVLAFTSKASRAPKAEGIPYDKGTR